MTDIHATRIVQSLVQDRSVPTLTWHVILAALLPLRRWYGNPRWRNRRGCRIRYATGACQQANLAEMAGLLHSRRVTVREDDSVLGRVRILDNHVQVPSGLRSESRELSGFRHGKSLDAYLEHDGRNPDGVGKRANSVQHVTRVLSYPKNDDQYTKYRLHRFTNAHGHMGAILRIEVLSVPTSQRVTNNERACKTKL